VLFAVVRPFRPLNCTRNACCIHPQVQGYLRSRKAKILSSAKSYLRTDSTYRPTLAPSMKLHLGYPLLPALFLDDLLDGSSLADVPELAIFHFLEEFVFVLTVSEYSGLVDPSHRDAVEGPGDIQSGLSRHGEIIETPCFLCQANCTIRNHVPLTRPPYGGFVLG
jgi:hypothetical protein